MPKLCWAVALIAVFGTGCTPSEDAKPSTQATNESAGSMTSMPGMNMIAPQPADSQATREYKQAMVASMQNMPPFTGDADRDFMQQMRVHHLAAIQMSETLLRHGKDEKSRALAQEILKAQQAEIAEIDAWLARRH